MTGFGAVDLGEVVSVLRLARDGWPSDTWSTAGFASAMWNGLIATDGAATLTDKGRAFLSRFDAIFPEQD